MGKGDFERGGRVRLLVKNRQGSPSLTLPLRGRGLVDAGSEREKSLV